MFLFSGPIVSQVLDASGCMRTVPLVFAINQVKRWALVNSPGSLNLPSKFLNEKWVAATQGRYETVRGSLWLRDLILMRGKERPGDYQKPWAKPAINEPSGIKCFRS